MCLFVCFVFFKFFVVVVGTESQDKAFNPLLITSGSDASGLNLVAGNALLFLNLNVSNHYGNVTFSYNDKCTTTPTMNPSSVLTCDTIYRTQIAYTNVCNFDISDLPNDASKLMFSGYLYVNSTRYINFLGQGILQEYSTIRGWFVTLPKTLDVSTTIDVTNTV